MNERSDVLSVLDMLREISPLGGYAEGGYMCECRHCKRLFEGDKRAIECLPCAVSRRVIPGLVNQS